MNNPASTVRFSFLNPLLIISKEKLYGIILGIVVFVQTLAFIPHAFSLVALFVVIIFRFEKIKQFHFDWRINKNLLLLCIIILAGTINRLLFIEKFESISDILPYFVLMLVSFAIAMECNRYFFITLLFCTFIESAFCFYEYYLGVSTIFTSLELYEIFPKGATLLYNTRVMGLSENSSNVSEKIFIAFLIIDIVKPRKIFAWILRLIFFTVLYMTFSRTAILALVIYAVLQAASFIWKTILSKEKLLWTSAGIGACLLLMIFIGGSAYLIPKYQARIFTQFTRNQGHIELSGREQIWKHFGDFIETNLWFGNGSYKKYVPYDNHYNDDGTLVEAHAHNSFLELLGSHGLFIFLLYLLLIFVNIRSYNWLQILAILIFSFTQYAIFWGISYFDIIFFAVLFNRKIFQKEFVP